ncbi:MAG: hypothetical protein WA191_16540 [Telluria sp.]|nr:hypothetical protein [Telluria sp.]
MEPIRLRLVKGGQEGQLLSEGWTKQTTIGEPRLSEIAENYRNMGYEVCVIDHPVEPSGDGCNTCFSAGPTGGEKSGDIFTRPGTNAKALQDDLY